MEKIPYTMVLHTHIDGTDTIFATMSGSLVNNPMEKWIGVIKRGTYQASSEDRRWAYEPVKDLWPNVEPGSDSSDNVSSDKVRKALESLDDKEQEEVVSVLRSNPGRIIRGDQRELIQIKIDIEISNDKLFFIKYMSSGSTHTKWYLVQVDMDQSNPVSMSNYGVYCFR